MPNTAHFDNLPTITRTGIIFRPGDYGPKGSYSAEDIDAMAGDTPLPVNLEHRRSLLDGKLGQLTRRFSGFDENGQKVLMGEWHEPEPLARLLGDTTRKASIEIDLTTKQPVGLALTHLPHIEDAALFHAVEDAFAKFSRGEEVKPLSFTPQENPVMSTDNAQAATPAAEQPKPTLIDTVKAFFTGAKPEEIAEFKQAIVVAETGKTLRELELEKQLAQFTANTETQRVADIKAAAETEANALIDAKKILPADKEATVAAFTVAAEIDAKLSELACFTDESPAPAQFKMTDHLKAVYAKVPEHDKTGEQAGGFEPGAIAAFEQQDTTVTDKATGQIVQMNKDAADKIIRAREEAAKK